MVVVFYQVLHNMMYGAAEDSLMLQIFIERVEGLYNL